MKYIYFVQWCNKCVVLIIIHFDAYSCIFLSCHIYCLLWTRKIKDLENENDLLKLENKGYRKEIALSNNNCLLVIID